MYIFKEQIQDSKSKILFELDTVRRDDILLYPDDISAAWNADFSFGGFLEKRNFYETETKSMDVIHAGLDLFVPQGTEVLSPFDGLLIASHWTRTINYKNGRGSGTQVVIYYDIDEVAKNIDLKKIKGIKSDTKFLRFVFIHLSKDSTKIFGKVKNKVFKDIGYKSTWLKQKENHSIKKGDVIGYVGKRYENGGWAPHLHLEISPETEIPRIMNIEIFNDFENYSSIGTMITNDKELIDPDDIFNFSKGAKKMKMILSDATSNSEDFVSINNLSVSYDEDKILDDVSLKIKKGELVSILGPSGTGKTTLLNAIAGFVKTDKGSVYINNIKNNKNIGYVFQDSLLYQNLDVFHNIAITLKNDYSWKVKRELKFYETIFNNEHSELLLSAKSLVMRIEETGQYKNDIKKLFKIISEKTELKFNLKSEIKSRVMEVVNILDIHKHLNKKQGQLSGGQRQRVAIAKALAKEPSLLIMDEPLASLDAKIKDKTSEWIKDLQRKLNITMIFVTHDQNVAMLMSDKIILLNNGNIEQYDTPENIFNKPKTLFIAKFIGFPEINLIEKTKTSERYIRPSDMTIQKKPNGKFVVMEIETNGSQFFYKVKKLNKYFKIIANNNKIIIGDNVDVIFNDKKVLEYKIESKDDNEKQ